MINRKVLWLPAVVAVVAAVLWWWSAAVPGGYLGVELWGLGLWLLAVAVVVSVGWFAVADLPRPRRRHVRALWPFLLVPALFAVTVGAAGTARRVAFELYRPALERVADEAVTGAVHDRWIGPYEFSSVVRQQGGCTLFTVDELKWGTGSGFARCPDGRPRDVSTTRFTPVDGHWYEYSTSW